jgi:hypothetical protein
MASDNYKSNDPSYGAQNQWSHMQGYNSAGSHHNTPPLHDYQSYDFSPPPPTSMSMDMPYHMGRPSNYAPQHQLPPLAIQPMVQIWPSMLTGPNQPTPSYQTPILPAVPVQTPVSAVSTASEATPTSAMSTKSSSSRRKLTDDERRKMCIEAATNPNMKQTQIGRMCSYLRCSVTANTSKSSLVLREGLFSTIMSVNYADRVTTYLALYRKFSDRRTST